jgi:hypothetical protein
MNSTSDTESDLRNICNNICKTPKSDCNDNNKCNIIKYQSGCVPYQECYKSGKYDPGISYFNSIITPLSNIQPAYSGCKGSVEFRMRRKNKTVSLQWEEFTGNLMTIGIDKLTVIQSICNTPPYVMNFPIMMKFGGNVILTSIIVDPYKPDNKGNIFFKLPSYTNSNISITIYSSCVSWIVD